MQGITAMNERRDRSPARAADAAAPRDPEKAYLDERLDDALKETFPASDPIAVTPPRRRRAAPAPTGRTPA